MKLLRQTIPFESREKWLELRAPNINSTETPCLFGVSPYQTLFELWHRKKSGDLVSIEETERMKWGSRLESVIAEGVAQDKGWGDVEPFKSYMQLEGLRIGSSFDYRMCQEQPQLIEIKNVDGRQYRETWIENEDGTIEAPLHIELQVQHQMLVSGYDTAQLCALVGGNTVVVTERKYNPKVGDAILKKTAEFWASIDAGIPPTPDFEKDAEYIISLHNYADPGKVMQATEEILDLASAYKTASDIIKDFETKKKEIKAKLLMQIDQAEKVIGEKFSISAAVRGPIEVEAHTRAGYRDFRINWKKEKTNGV